VIGAIVKVKELVIVERVHADQVAVKGATKTTADTRGVGYVVIGNRLRGEQHR